MLIYSIKSRTALLVEVKSSVGEPVNAVLKPLEDQISNVIMHRKELEEQAGAEINNFEYVVCGPPQDIEEVGKSITDHNVCLWSADLQYSTLKIYNPSGTKNSVKLQN